MGFFSFKTKDTDKVIYNVFSKHYDDGAQVVYMVNPLTKETFKEEHYEGYGEFGGKDFYVLYAEINNLITEDIRDNFYGMRSAGISHFYNEEIENKIYPVLIENLKNLKNALETNEKPRDHSGQGYWKD
ncbi:hypothetical protein [Helicobacter anatolicus]|uniref:hypothetical protein n=1 Tax=Helicobacter anatolicus TaxID=2905874 RepID=UPI001E305DE0|nr:hypothetical protein [Helicobacter anatolicus]MCE3040486.1 hypothetical protein [Helicobacter anatolicus]